MAVIAIRLPNELINQIDEWGAERGMTRSESIRRWIKNGVDEPWRPLKQRQGYEFLEMTRRGRATPRNKLCSIGLVQQMCAGRALPRAGVS